MSPKARFAAVLEATLFAALAVLIGCWHVFWSGTPLLTLLFDSQGYLLIGAGIIESIKANFPLHAAEYLWSGFGESARAAALTAAAPIADIHKSGPVVPAIVALAFSIAGKAPIAANWSIPAVSFILLHGLTTGAIWFGARSLGGTSCARIAGVVAAFYPGFLANCGRILSEPPATFAVALVAALILYAITRGARHAERQRMTVAWLLYFGIVGGALGLMSLARPTLLLLAPLLAIGFVCADRRKGPLLKFLALVLGVCVAFAPWALTKFILSGTPSITVDRYGPYNLYTGCSLASDGWDVLPSEWVAHPERFKLGMPEVLSAVSTEAQRNPADFAFLMLRKPARLADGPWNDFQVPILGVPYLLQQWWHQVLLSFAIVGTALCLGSGRLSSFGEDGAPQSEARPDQTRRRFAGLLLASIVVFHFIACLFITMHRYMVTAMPVIIILASYAMAELARAARVAQPNYESGGVTHWRRILLGAIVVPTLYALLSALLHDAPTAIVGDAYPTVLSNTEIVGAVLSTIFAAAVLVSAYLIATALSLPVRSPVAVWLSVPLLIALCGGASIYWHSLQLALWQPVKEATLTTRPVKLEESGMASMEGMALSAVLADFHGSSVQESAQLGLTSGAADFPRFLPLLALMQSGRENSKYLKAFAYSSGKEISEIHQWWCALMEPGDDAEKKLRSFSYPESLKVAVAGHKGQLSPIAFSWSKGFFADLPGEMRMPAPSSRVDCPVGPRMLLVSSPGRSSAQPFQPLTVELPDVEISTHPMKRMSRQSIELVGVNDSMRAWKDVGYSALLVTVKGLAHSPDGARPSVCLIEHIKNQRGSVQDFSPLAPDRLTATPAGTPFFIYEVLPLSEGTSLEMVELLCATRPWWEVLSYGSYKGTGTTRLTRLRVQFQPFFQLPM